MNPMTGVWLSMATGWSEGTGKAGGTEELPSTSRNGNHLSLGNFHELCLWQKNLNYSNYIKYPNLTVDDNITFKNHLPV